MTEQGIRVALETELEGWEQQCVLTPRTRRHAQQESQFEASFTAVGQAQHWMCLTIAHWRLSPGSWADLSFFCPILLPLLLFIFLS